MAQMKSEKGTVSLSTRSAMVVYTVSNLVLTLLEFHASLLFHNSTPSTSASKNYVSRASLQLLTSLSLLPILKLPSATFDASNKRAPILASFLVGLSLLIDAMLRLLPCFQALIYGYDPDIVNTSTFFVVCHVLVHSTWLFLTRRRPGHQPGSIEARMLLEGLVIPTDLATDATIKILRVHALTFLLLRVTAVLTRFLAGWNRVSVAIMSTVIVACASMTWPTMTEAIFVLLQAAPSDRVQSIPTRRQKVLDLDGVVECSHVHIWEETKGLIVGTLSVSVHPSACKYTVLRRSITAFDGLVDDLTVQVDSWRAT